jgi:hypothetical protein
MRLKILNFIILICSINYSFASDSTYKKYPWQLSVMLGYNSNTVTGSMVDFTNHSNGIEGLSDAIQTNKGGYSCNISLQKNISEYFYFKTGLGFSHKQVYPENNTNHIYRDSLNTNYFNIPLVFGSSISLNNKQTVHIYFETGFSADIKISDKSSMGPDRASFETLPSYINFQASGGADISVSKNVAVVLQYQYTLGLSNAYKEELYYGATNQPIFTGYYKYLTNSISIGIKWKI